MIRRNITQINCSSNTVYQFFELMRTLRISKSFVTLCIVVYILTGCSNSNIDNIVEDNDVNMQSRYLINVEKIIINQPQSDILNTNNQTLFIEKKLMQFLKSSFQPNGFNGNVQITVENVNFDKHHDNNGKSQHILFNCNARIRFLINKQNDSGDERLNFTINAWNKRDIVGSINSDEMDSILKKQTNSLIRSLQKELDKKLSNILRGNIKKAPISNN